MSRKGSKKQPPVILEKALTKEMAEKRANAVKDATFFRNKKATQEDIAYNLSLLDAFDKVTRPTVPLDAKLHGNRRYTPIQLYEAMLGYFHICLENGRYMTISHLTWFCGFDKNHFDKILNGTAEDKSYDFVRDFVGFMAGHIEYAAQDKQNPAFQIFWLKQRGWKDKYEIEASSTIGALTEAERAANIKRIAEFSEGIVKPDGIK